MTPVWVTAAAARFWADAGLPPAVPRDLTRAAAAVGLAVVLTPHLTLASAHAFLARIGQPVPTDEPDRPLRACLYCRGGRAVVFVDAADPPAERRFSLAHEVAHYLTDYAAPRRVAAARLGPAALDVLDGRRPPTADERLAGLLLHAPAAPHVHLMSRDAGGRPATPAERAAEDRADRLAYELLAPAGLLHAEADPAALAARLEAGFGLPPAAAAGYARILLPQHPPDRLLAALRESW